ncbi:MAG: type II toxin-antitoxin system RelE/ParE family toxin [Sulfuritalea sp.]|nr:type II toxin-antitoxin system RelE/ParE family toxin [Sulfuritalea sp.]
MPKRLEWSKRAEADRDRLLEYYAETVSAHLAEIAEAFITQAVENLGCTGLFCIGPESTARANACWKRFPSTIVYRATAGSVLIVRILHQAQKYFN